MIKRRYHTLEFKQQLVTKSSGHGASVAGVAMSPGINANQLHKWRRDLLRPIAPATRNALLPVIVEPAPIMIGAPANESCSGAIEIELRNARLTVRGRVDLDALQTILAVLRPR